MTPRRQTHQLTTGDPLRRLSADERHELHLGRLKRDIDAGCSLFWIERMTAAPRFADEWTGSHEQGQEEATASQDEAMQEAPLPGPIVTGAPFIHKP